MHHIQTGDSHCLSFFTNCKRVFFLQIEDSITVELVYITRKSSCVNARGQTARHVASARYAALSPNGGGGLPNPVLDGGVPHLVLDRGYPSSLGWEVPHPVLDGGYPTWTWDGVPPSWLDGVPPCLDLGWGSSPVSWMGYPPAWTWDGVPHCLDLG